MPCTPSPGKPVARTASRLPAEASPGILGARPGAHGITGHLIVIGIYAIIVAIAGSIRYHAA